MRSTDADRLSSTSAHASPAADIPSTSVINFASGSTLARDPFPRTAEVDTADLPFLRPLAWSAPLAPVAEAPAAIPFPRPRIAEKERPGRTRREHLIQRSLEILPGATALLIISTCSLPSICTGPGAR
jgi:hypothetical protein